MKSCQTKLKMCPSNHRISPSVNMLNTILPQVPGLSFLPFSICILSSLTEAPSLFPTYVHHHRKGKKQPSQLVSCCCNSTCFLLTIAKLPAGIYTLHFYSSRPRIDSCKPLQPGCHPSAPQKPPTQRSMVHLSNGSPFAEILAVLAQASVIMREPL